MYEKLVTVRMGRRGDVPEGGDGLMADGGTPHGLGHLAVWGRPCDPTR